MKEVTKEVKMRGVVVDTATINICESMDDVTSAFTEAEILALVNSQNTANICNKARAKHREKAAGKGKRYEMAFNCLPGVTFEDGQSGIEKLNAAVASDNPKAALDTLLASPEVQAEVDRKLAAA